MKGFVVAILLLGALTAPAAESARFRISEEVVVPDPPRFGLNFFPTRMSHWDTEPWINEWSVMTPPDAFHARLKFVAAGGGPGHIEGQSASGRTWGMDFYKLFRTGFFDGAEVEVFRHSKDAPSKLVRKGTVGRFLSDPDAGQFRLEFASEGEPVQAGDEVFLTKTNATEIPAGSLNPKAQVFAGSLISGLRIQGDNVPEGLKMTLDPSSIPPGRGAASLRVTLPKNGAALGDWLHSGQEADWPRLREGAPYEFRVWLRQEGIPTGKVTLRAGTLGNTEIEVTPEWKEYTLRFAGGPPAGSSPERLEIAANEGGTLWIARPSLVELGAVKPGEFYPEVIEALRAGRPGWLRLWSLHMNSGFGPTLDSVLKPDGGLVFAPNGLRAVNALPFARELALCRDIGANPWLIVSPFFSGEEWKNLVEYLAGPPDSPYGRLRAKQGQATPWTEVFSEIILEVGNESWNSSFSPTHFSGRAHDYGSLAAARIAAARSAPSFASAAGRIKFAVNGWIAQTDDKGFSFHAAAANPEADYATLAMYVGGWDSVAEMASADPAEKLREGLLFFARALEWRSDEFRRTLEALSSKRPRPIRPALYEGGPGYSLPKPGSFDPAEQEFGKSQAKAIATLDAYMHNLANGFGPQCFYKFKNGHYWSSHNRRWQPHTAWLALSLRNLYCEGDLITATMESGPALSLPAIEVPRPGGKPGQTRTLPALDHAPLIRCHPFLQGDRLSVLVLSRDTEKPTPLEIELPRPASGPVTAHLLAAASPAAHNIGEPQVTIQTAAAKADGTRLTFDLPACSAAVLVVSLTAAPQAAPAASPEANSEPAPEAANNPPATAP